MNLPKRCVLLDLISQGYSAMDVTAIMIVFDIITITTTIDIAIIGNTIHAVRMIWMRR